MSPKKPTVVWYGHDHADAYLLASAHHLARAATQPLTLPLPPPSVSATLYCAFAAEAYVNVALIRILDEEEYQPMSRVPVRSKYYLATRLGLREEWFSAGERTLEALDELFSQRNRLVHAQPERSVLSPFSDPEDPDLHTDLRNVAHWVSASADAAARLGRSHAELYGFERVAGRVAEMEPLLANFDPARDGPVLQRNVRKLAEGLLREDERDFMDDEELDHLVSSHDPDWDLRGLDPPTDAHS
jgi:hypothetical protein